MPKFKVTASYVSYCHAEIEADNLEHAEELARELDGGEFIPADRDDWNIEEVEEIPQELTEEQEAFLATYADAVADATPEQVRQFLQMDDDAFIEKYSTGTYSSIMDARLVWLQALNFADTKPRG